MNKNTQSSKSFKTEAKPDVTMATNYEQYDWKNPKPFVIEHTVIDREIDHLTHVNNKVYLDWMEKLMWAHSLAVGIDRERISGLGKVMVIGQHEMNYWAGCYLGDELLLGTWVGPPLSPKKRMRYFQFIRKSDGKTVFTGHNVWICMDLKTHKSTEMPPEYIEPYKDQYE